MSFLYPWESPNGIGCCPVLYDFPSGSFNTVAMHMVDFTSNQIYNLLYIRYTRNIDGTFYNNLKNTDL